jgi:predicted MFS family arabinose efflux permease
LQQRSRRGFPSASRILGCCPVSAQVGRALILVNPHACGARTWRGRGLDGIDAPLSGLFTGLPAAIGAGLPTASLRERVAVVRLPGVLWALLVTTLWATGAYTLYTYIAPYLTMVLGLKGAHVGYVLFLYGFAAFAGLLFGGAASDRFGAVRIISAKLPLMAVALFSLSFCADYLTLAHALLPVLISVFIWGFTAWGFFPAQQTRLIGVAGIKVAPIILSLNASFMYLGFSVGAALGSFTLAHGGVADLGRVAALCVLGSLILFLVTHYRTVR